jgi:HSP20 family protein
MATGRRMLSNLLVLHEELEELIGDVFGVRARGGRANSWSPAADVFVLKDTLVIRFELAGVRREEIDLSFREGELIVQGTRLECEEEPKQRYWQMEISHGSFRRSLKIPVPVDAEKIQAECHDGILEVRLPLAAESPSAREVRIGTDG